MATVNSASLRDEFDAYKADFASLRKEGKITKKIDVPFTGVCDLLAILIAVFLEKTTKKNSSIPPDFRPFGSLGLKFSLIFNEKTLDEFCSAL